MKITLVRGSTSPGLFSYIAGYLERRPVADEIGIGKFNYLLYCDDQKGISGNLEEEFILKRAEALLKENPVRVFEGNVDFPSPPAGDSRESYSAILDHLRLEGLRNMKIDVDGEDYFFRHIGKLNLPANLQRSLIDIARVRASEQHRLFYTWPSMVIARYTERVQ